MEIQHRGTSSPSDSRHIQSTFVTVIVCLTYIALEGFIRQFARWDCGAGDGFALLSCVENRVLTLLSQYLVLSITAAIWSVFLMLFFRLHAFLRYAIPFLFLVSAALWTFLQYQTLVR